MQSTWVPIVRAPRRGTIDDLALVLAAEGIPHEVQAGSGWTLSVPLHRFGDAAAILAAYEAEERQPLPLTFEEADAPASQIGVVVAFVLLAIHAVLALGGWDEAALRAGRVSYTRVMDGELWRCVTALTLHAGPFHVASNAVACAVFGNLLGRTVGPGVALWLMLLSGAIGNGLNVLWRGAPHLSVGASTAVFGIVGALSGLQAERYRRIPAMSARAWVPLAGGVALLALLGASPESDFVAHVGGLISGAVLGLSLHVVLPQRPGDGMQRWLLISAGALIALGWGLALASRG